MNDRDRFQKLEQAHDHFLKAKKLLNELQVDRITDSVTTAIKSINDATKAISDEQDRCDCELPDVSRETLFEDRLARGAQTAEEFRAEYPLMVMNAFCTTVLGVGRK